MKATRIEIRNFLGLQELVIEPGRVTEISGANGAGKTSVLSALSHLLGGGHDVQVIRRGADKAEVLLELDDGSLLRKVTTSKGSRLTLTRDGAQQSAPQAWVNDLIAADGLNPLAALDPSRRRDFLLEVLDVRIDQDELRQLLGTEPPPVNLDQHALLVLDQVHQYLFAQRREAGRVRRSKEAAAQEARAALRPTPGSPESIEQRARQITDQLDEQRVLIRTEEARQAEADRQAGATLRAEAEVEAAAAETDRIRQQLELAERRLAEAHGRLQAIRSAAAVAGPDQQVIAAAQRRVQDLLEQRAQVEQDRRVLAEHQRVEELERAAAEAHASWERLDHQVRAVGPDAQAQLIRRAGLLEGLTYQDGGFHLRGVPVEKLSQSETLRLAVRLVKLRDTDRPLKLMLVDGCECLDGESLQELAAEQAKEDGWSYVVTTVDHDSNPLAVRTREGALAKQS